MITKRIGRSGG